MRNFDASRIAAELVPVGVLETLGDTVGDFMVVGAVAMDLIVHGLADLPLGRATKDLDIGIAVATERAFWRRVEQLHDPGVTSFRFEVEGFPVDVLPFGPIASRGLVKIRDVEIDVTGMAGANESAMTVKLTSDMTVRSASLPGLIVLKLVAWRPVAPIRPRTLSIWDR